MPVKNKNHFKEVWRRGTEFLHFVRTHRIDLQPRFWWKGVLLLLFGWGLIAFNSVLFDEPLKGIRYKGDFALQFASAMVTIFLLLLVRRPLQVRSSGIFRFLTVSAENEISGTAILPPRTRKFLIFWRGIIGAGGYIGFQLARTAVGTIDNAVIYGADSLMYVLLALILLKERYNVREWTGIITVLFGVGIIVFFDLGDMDRGLAIRGCLLGLGSSLSLAIILVLTSIIVQHDHPIRVTFYQCLYGFLIAFFLVMISPNKSDLLSLDLIRPAFEGMSYAVAVVCFLQAFYYVDPIIVAISSYCLEVYYVIFNYIVNARLVELRTAISAILIAVGSAILIRGEYKRLKNKK